MGLESQVELTDLDLKKWEKKRATSTSLSSDTSIPVNLLQPVTSSTNAVVSTRGPLKSLRRRPPRWAKDPSSTLGSSTSLKPNVSEVSPSISPSGNSRPPNQCVSKPFPHTL